MGLIRPHFLEVFMAISKAKRKPNVWVENFKTIVYAGLIAIGIRTFAYEPFSTSPPAA